MAETYNLIPVHREVLVDTETPISIFLKLLDRKPCFLLESVEGGEALGRYSFIGLNPSWIYTHQAGVGTVNGVDLPEGRPALSGSPLDSLRKLVGRYRIPPEHGLPRFFGGAVGYFGYDFVRTLEDLPDKTCTDVPDCAFVFPKVVLIFDHVRHSLRLVANSTVASSPVESYREAVGDIEEILALIQARPGDPNHNSDRTAAEQPLLRSNLSREEFKDRVVRAKEYIRQGDILQVVLSRRFTVPCTGTGLDVYRRLRFLNPSPYLYYLDFGDTLVVGASPEMLVRVEDGKAYTRPIAGTRRRGTDPREDAWLAEDLLGDEKERAEHVMLVDLGRNDLSRVCVAGSVEVTQFMNVERYSHVMHLTSQVEGRLQDGHDALSALAAAFPAGTVSGAPKVRAMEIIDELESGCRGIYAGAAGYIGLNGNLDTCIAIRTVVIRDGEAIIQAGAGIVADSDPEREAEEVRHKAAVLIKAVRGTELAVDD
ncbi:MAG: anthranilate synthase component I [Clostridia bacterium]|jgi:anthranilate synthase component 1|nr:anthranilate synthase component I [Clostridia bacterium]MDQ7791751.1 anthranilate synthase component I [Clostridia bacterium]